MVLAAVQGEARLVKVDFGAKFLVARSNAERRGVIQNRLGAGELSQLHPPGRDVDRGQDGAARITHVAGYIIGALRVLDGAIHVAAHRLEGAQVVCGPHLVFAVADVTSDDPRPLVAADGARRVSQRAAHAAKSDERRHFEVPPATPAEQEDGATVIVPRPLLIPTQMQHVGDVGECPRFVEGRTYLPRQRQSLPITLHRLVVARDTRQRIPLERERGHPSRRVSHGLCDSYARVNRVQRLNETPRHELHSAALHYHSAEEERVSGFHSGPFVIVDDVEQRIVAGGAE
jgi:hypothetical protein